MVRKCCLILGMLLISIKFIGAINSSRTIESLGMYSNILHQNISYSIYLPAGYDTASVEFPVVYLLHGLGDNETAWIEYGRIAQVADKAIAEKKIVPMVFVIPQGFRSYYVNAYDGSFNYQDMFIHELIPYIESTYKVGKDKSLRATLGYSMGGFGALVLPLQNPEFFTACVPLSISIRTDEQYITEDANGWDEQWGKIFGYPGAKGYERLTEYYKNNSPFHIIANSAKGTFDKLRIYIDNGDDENTLAYSNEMLHILMRNLRVPHEYRVRNGGHTFTYWRESLDNGLRFLSDAFEGKPYRGDMKNEVSFADVALNANHYRIMVEDLPHDLFTPPCFHTSSRNYPVVYVLADLTFEQKKKIAGLINSKIIKGHIPPIMVLFVSSNLNNRLLSSIVPVMESKHKARKGFRFRAIIGVEAFAEPALAYATQVEEFTACVLFNGSSNFDVFQASMKDVNPRILERTWFYFDSPDQGQHYLFNGKTHLLFKECNIYHEYRVREGTGGFSWMLYGFEEALSFLVNKFHR